MLCQSLLDAEIVWRKADLSQAINNVAEQRRVAARQAQARKVYVEPEPKPASKPSTIERINRDLDAYDAAMRREHAQLLSEPTPQRPSDDVLHAQQDQLLDAIVENIANRGQVTGEAAPDPLGVRSVEFMPYDELREAKFMLQQVNSGWRWVWHRFDGDVLGNVKAAKAAAITEARRHYEKFHGAADAPDPDEAEAIALVAAETAQEDAERAARDAQRPSFERVPEPEPVAAPTTDALERLKRASLLRYMLIQARDAARRDYGDLTGRHTDMLEFERGVADMLPPLESLIAILEGTK